MSASNKLKFQELRDAFEFTGASVQSYSGRAMYGRSCLGVNCDNAITTILEAISGYVDTMESQIDADKICEFIDLMKNHRIDSLGRGTILYFPDIEWERSEEGDEDSSEDGDEDK